MNSARRLRPHPLDDAFARCGARPAQVFGWERPLYFNAGSRAPVLTYGRAPWFEQVRREVMAAHEHVAVFDQSTYGKIRVEGTDAESFLHRVCANDMRRSPGRVMYSAMLNERGGFESDLTALRLTAERYRLMVGTTAVKRDLAWLRRCTHDGEQVHIEDETEDYGVLAVMGPHALDTLAGLGGGTLAELPRFRHVKLTLAGQHVRAARVSYVGESGVELTCRAGDLPALYDALLAAGAVPAGLYAQTSMRVEKRYLAMGHELDGDVTPVEAGLEFALSGDGAFTGSPAVRARQAQGPSSRMVSIVLDDEQAVPLGDEPIYLGERIIGQATSAAFGYRVGRPVVLGYVEAEALDGHDDLAVSLDIAREPFPGTAHLRAAFDPDGQCMRAGFR